MGWYEIEVGTNVPTDHTEGELVFGITYPLPYWRWVVGKDYYKLDAIREYTLLSGNTTIPITKTFFARNLPRGKYDIKVTRISSEMDDKRYGDALYLSTVRQVYYDDFSYPRIALVGIKSLATSNISGSLKFSCMLEGKKVRVYDPNTTTWSVAYSNNPAWVCYDILTQPVFVDIWEASRLTNIGDIVVPTTLNGHIYTCTAKVAGDAYTNSTEPSWTTTNGTTQSDSQVTWTCGAGYTTDGVHRFDAYAPANLDYIRFSEWATWCDTIVAGSKRITFNGVFDTEMSAWDAALKVCEIGRANLLWNGNVITVVVDKEATETQLFTLGNIGIDSFKETFLGKDERAGEIEIDFVNKDRGYERDQYTLVSTAINKPNNKVSIQLMGCTSPDEAWRAARYRLLCNQYLLRSIEFNVDIDAIACTVGDVVRVQHSDPVWGYGGRVVSATSNTVTLDQSVTIAAGVTYEILIRLGDDTIVEKAISGAMAPGSYTTLTIVGTFSTIPAQFDLFTFGVLNTSHKPFRVTGLKKNSDQQITISAVEYNANIYTGDLESPVHPTIQYSSLSKYVEVSNLQLSQEVYVDNSESLFVNIHVAWDVGTNTIYRGARLYWREKITSSSEYSPWKFEKEYIGKRAIFSSAILGRTYEIGILGVNFTGVITPFTSLVTKEIVIDNDPSFYSDFLKKKVSGLQILDDPNNDTFSGSNVTISWNHISAVDSSIGAGYEEMGAGYRGPNIWLKDYEIVVKSSVGAILSTHYTKENRLTYTYVQNVLDGLNSSLIFEVKARSKLNAVSETAAKISVTNTNPADVDTITAEAYEDGVTFIWAVNSDEDIRGYYVRTQVDSDAWSSWFEIDKNTYSRDLTPTEKANQAWENSTINIEVKAIDLFGQYSAAATAGTGVCRNQKPYITVGVTTVLGDFTSLDTAISKLPSGGGAICIKNGDYQMTAPITIPSKNLEIFGESQEGVIVRNNPGDDLFVLYNLSNTFSFKNFTTIGTTDGKMFYIYGDVTTNNLASVAVQQIKMTLDATVNGIYYYKGRGDIVFSDNIISGGFYPIFAHYALNAMINDNRIDAPEQKGIYLYFTGADCNVVGNRITTTKKVGIEFLASRGKFDGNRIIFDSVNVINSGAVGIKTYGTAGNTVSNNVITCENIVSGTVLPIGIEVNPDGQIVVGNTITIAVNSGNVAYGIGLKGDNCLIANNTLYVTNAHATAMAHGISTFTSVVGYKNNTLNGNKIRLGGRALYDIGIMLRNATDSGNKGSGNDFKDCAVNISDNGTNNAINVSGGGGP